MFILKKNRVVRKSHNPLIFMEPMGGFEPPTY